MKAPTPPILLLQGIKLPSCHGYPTSLLSPRTYQLLSFSLHDPEAAGRDPPRPDPQCPDFPSPEPLGPANFVWGDFDGETFSKQIDEAYGEIVHWKRNLFVVPRGRSGTQFVCKLTRLLEGYSSATALESVGMKAVMVLPALLLQRPHHKSKDREHIARLEDRLSRWHDGDIASLLHEGRTIQDRLGNGKFTPFLGQFGNVLHLAWI